jgi:putative membrane protein
LKRLLILAAAIGLAGATGVVAFIGFGQIAAALGVIGWRGLVILIAYSAVPLSVLTLAWFVLERPWPWRRLRIYLWARLVRDASGELLPFSHLAGFAIGARAAASAGLSGSWALATTVVDATTELIAQVGFTLFGLCLLADRLDKHAELGGPAMIGFALTLAAAVSLVALQRRGMTFVTRLVERVLPTAAAHAVETGGLLSDLHGRTGRILLAILLHLGAWTLSGSGVWLALRVAGLEVRLFDIIGLEALIAALRTTAFIAPMGLGVQEVGYAVLGPLFGLNVEAAVALSLIKRARDLCVGLPVLALWQIEEGRRLVRPGRDNALEI